MHFTPFKFAPLALALTFSAGIAQASSPFASVSIATEGGSSYDLAMDSLLTSLPDGSVQLKSNLPLTWSDANNYGEWSTTTLDGKAAVSWHSWETVNGGAFVQGSNPWATKFTFSLLGHGDPDMTYAFSAVNNSNKTQTYGYTYGEDIDPAWTGAYDLTATMGVSLSQTDGSATVAPTLGNTHIQKVELSTNNGASYFNAGVDLGTGFVNNTAPTVTYAPLTASTSGSSASALTTWRFNTLFTLTSKRDAFAVTGTVTLIPEPQSYAMLLAGLGICAMLVYRNKRG